EKSEHRAHSVLREGVVVLLNDCGHAVFEALTCALERLVDLGRQELKRLEACAHGHWISREGSRLVDGAIWRHLAHILFFPAISGERESTAEDLAEAVEVRDDAVDFRRATSCDSEACHDFVQNQ